MKRKNEDREKLAESIKAKRSKIEEWKNTIKDLNEEITATNNKITATSNKITSEEKKLANIDELIRLEEILTKLEVNKLILLPKTGFELLYNISNGIGSSVPDMHNEVIDLLKKYNCTAKEVGYIIHFLKAKSVSENDGKTYY